MKIGMVGLAKSGKTTLFNALTGSAYDTAGYSGKAEPHMGTAHVPDPRLDGLASLFERDRAVPIALNFVDMAPLKREDLESESILGVAIGPTTRLSMLKMGWPEKRIVMAEDPSAAGILDAIHHVEGWQ